jgi:hypothetical protein
MPVLLLQLHPQVCGLHANADISYYTSSTKAMWSNLIDLQPRVGRAAGGISRETVVAGVARDISAKIPEQFDLPLLAKGLGVPTPTQVVLLQELARWNGVLDTMSTSLKELQRALSGERCRHPLCQQLLRPWGNQVEWPADCKFSVGRHGGQADGDSSCALLQAKLGSVQHWRSCPALCSTANCPQPGRGSTLQQRRPWAPGWLGSPAGTSSTRCEPVWGLV